MLVRCCQYWIQVTNECRACNTLGLQAREKRGLPPQLPPGSGQPSPAAKRNNSANCKQALCRRRPDHQAQLQEGHGDVLQLRHSECRFHKFKRDRGYHQQLCKWQDQGLDWQALQWGRDWRIIQVSHFKATAYQKAITFYNYQQFILFAKLAFLIYKCHKKMWCVKPG